MKPHNKTHFAFQALVLLGLFSAFIGIVVGDLLGRGVLRVDAFILGLLAFYFHLLADREAS